MSDVIIRCPNCGTTQRALGECEACHEADVRYFCTNHGPGQWLDGAACPVCGARYGVDPERSRPDPRERPEPPETRRTRPLPPREPEPALIDVWTGPVHAPESGEVGEVVEIGSRGLEPHERVRIESPFSAETVRLAATASGCVRRAIVLFVILLALAALAFFGLLGVGMRLL